MDHTKWTQRGKLPELLCPAGSPLALDAAIEGGADAVYLGGNRFNARIHASNFDPQDLIDGIRRAHLYGVRVYVTLNTLLYDRELSDALRAAESAQNAGADALIVADLGAASLIHRHLPELELHASTQAGAHGAAAGEMLRDIGFSRMVVARELCLSDLRAAVEHSPIEVEAFAHGALCVCHSGQCLFSSMVGGRSGNRGECAQPCRLPFRTPAGKSDYPLSLKDLSLSRHVPALIDAGVSSLKIEGRMRSPEYVLTVTRIWRRLLDEGRGASEDEMQQLAEAFSRGGFTDGYFTSRIGKGMLGIRSEQDKEAGRALAPFKGLSRRLPLTLHAELSADRPATLTATANGCSYTATGEIPQAARTTPLTEQTVARQLTRLGNTPFEATECRVQLSGELMLPISALNALRRAAVSGLEEQLIASPTPAQVEAYLPVHPRGVRSATPTTSAQMLSISQLTERAAQYFDICYLPAQELLSVADASLSALMAKTRLGVALPPVITDGEVCAVKAQLDALLARGVDCALVSNLGHLPLVRAVGMQPHGSERLGVTNTETVAALEALGIAPLTLSPELSLPKIRDIEGDVRTVVYGRLPLMLLEKCVIREIADCKACDGGAVQLTDRRGVSFPVLRLPDHRNVIYNSLPTYAADEQGELLRYRAGGRHFIFCVEGAREVDRVIQCFEQGSKPLSPVRRIGR